ncbi:MAG TPA: MmgE/PrpD family protein [Candidatus Dormibacteraeota bacterium]
MERAPNEYESPRKCEQIAAWAAERRFEEISADRLPYLKVLVLDSLGCAIGALRGEPIQPIRGLIEELGGSPQCTLIGGGRTAADHAAFHNGALVRYLDFMDIFMVPGQTCHPSDNLAPVLAATELAGGSGADFLVALAVAYQVQGRFSELAPLQEKGFDHVSHLAFSMAAGCARALGLEPRAGANAIALCACSTNTLWVVRTARLSNWKGLASAQAGMACTHMTLLAARGITGPLNLMEGPQGWEEVVGDRVEVDWTREPLDQFSQSCVKRYNAEAHTQSMLECLLDLRETHAIRPERVARVEIEIFKQALNIVGGGDAGDRTLADSKEQADHSIPYLCAVALLDGDVWPPQLTNERVRRPDVQQLLQRVWVRQRESLTVRYPEEMPSRVRVALEDGSEVTGEKADYLGFWRTRPLDWAGAEAKFDRLAGPLLDTALRREIPQAVQALETIPIRELCELLGRAGAD